MRGRETRESPKLIASLSPFYIFSSLFSQLRIRLFQHADNGSQHVNSATCRCPKAEEAVRHFSSGCSKVASLTYISQSDSKFSSRNLYLSYLVSFRKSKGINKAEEGEDGIDRTHQTGKCDGIPTETTGDCRLYGVLQGAFGDLAVLLEASNGSS